MLFIFTMEGNECPNPSAPLGGGGGLVVKLAVIPKCFIKFFSNPLN